MFIKRTHYVTATQGTYIFPYVIGKVNNDRCWRASDSEVLLGGLPDDALSNQLFDVNYRLGFVGAQLHQHGQGLVETIQVAYLSKINMDVVLNPRLEFTSSSEREKSRGPMWRKFEEILNHSFGLEVR
jgi:hypothetical protein